MQCHPPTNELTQLPTSELLCFYLASTAAIPIIPQLHSYCLLSLCVTDYLPLLSSRALKMTTPYQPLNYPDSATAVSATAADSCCGPNCGGCPARPGCCIEPNCCSRVGACPCFCTGSTATFSVALMALWIALPLLITCMSMVDLFEMDVYRTGSSVYLGMWSACGYNLGGYNNNRYWSYSCTEYGGQVAIGDAFNSTAVFNAMRSLTVICTVTTFAAALLASIRLGMQQRAKTISSTLNSFLLLSAVLAASTATAAFTLSCILFTGIPTYWNYGNFVQPTRGASWAVLTAAFGMLMIGVPLHLVANYNYQRAITQQSSEQPGMEGIVYPDASSSVFTHPQPQYFAAVAYPTAAAIPQSPPPTHASMQSSQLFLPAAQPTYLYAR